MPHLIWFEIARDDLFAHAIQKQKRGRLAIAGQKRGECGRQRCFGNDFRFDSGRNAVGPGFTVAFNGGKTLLLANEGVEFAGARLGTQVSHPFISYAESAQFEYSF